MNTEAVKIFYDLLGHKKQTEIRAMELSKDFKISKVKGHYFVSSQEDFIKKIQGLNEKYNVYAGLNERIDRGTEAKDVISVKRNNIFCFCASIYSLIKPSINIIFFIKPLNFLNKIFLRRNKVMPFYLTYLKIF